MVIIVSLGCRPLARIRGMRVLDFRARLVRYVAQSSEKAANHRVTYKRSPGLLLQDNAVLSPNTAMTSAALFVRTHRIVVTVPG